MAKNEKTSNIIASKASKALKHPEKMSLKEIKAIAASALTQAPDKKVKMKKKKSKVH